jgi:hypothetical protein
LNFVLTNGEIALCFCFETPKGFGPDRAFFSKSVPWYQLHFQTDAHRFTIASEPLNPAEPCIPAPHGQFLEVRRKDARLEIDLHTVKSLSHV